MTLRSALSRLSQQWSQARIRNLPRLAGCKFTVATAKHIIRWAIIILLLFWIMQALSAASATESFPLASNTRYECGLIVSVNVDRGATGSRRRVNAVVVGGRGAAKNSSSRNHIRQMLLQIG